MESVICLGHSGQTKRKGARQFAVHMGRRATISFLVLRPTGDGQEVGTKTVCDTLHNMEISANLTAGQNCEKNLPSCEWLAGAYEFLFTIIQKKNGY